jgi:hypothetical protein
MMGGMTHSTRASDQESFYLDSPPFSLGSSICFLALPDVSVLAFPEGQNEAKSLPSEEKVSYLLRL